MSLDRKQRVMLVLGAIFCLWHLGTQWTTTLLSFLQWDTAEVMTIVDLGYIQAFGSIANALGALVFGQIADTTGPKTMFLVSVAFTSVYYCGISMANSWYAFFFLQIFRFGYQLDGTAEMYLATVTTESERTAALMRLTFPQAIAMFIGPMLGSKIAAFTSLRVSQFICGIVLFSTLTPVLLLFLPATHSIPRLASARLRPQDYWHMIMKNTALKEGLVIRTLLISAYVCYEMVSRNYLLRQYMKTSDDSMYILLTMAVSLLFIQFVVLPVIQRRSTPKVLLQLALVLLIISYFAVIFASSFEQMLIITAIQTAGYAVAYAESCTQITSAVETTDLGKATGLASMIQWMTHFFMPIYASNLVQYVHYEYAFYSSIAISVVSLIFVTRFAKNTNNRSGTLLPSLTVSY